MKKTGEVKQGSMRVKTRAPGPSTFLAKAARLKVFGKSPVGFYLRLNRSIWETIPAGLRNLYPVRSYGAWLHSLVRLHATRQQYFATFFLRNRPALELMRDLAEKKAEGSTLRIAVLACSIGAEVYSILWTIRSARPDSESSRVRNGYFKENIGFRPNWYLRFQHERIGRLLDF